MTADRILTRLSFAILKPPSSILSLRQDSLHHFPRDVCQPIVASLETVGELRMFDAEQVHHRGVQVMHVDGVFDDVVAEVIGPAMDQAWLDATAGHPN